MKYSLVSREPIADCVETMLRAHCFDGMVCIPGAGKPESVNLNCITVKYNTSG